MLIRSFRLFLPLLVVVAGLIGFAPTLADRVNDLERRVEGLEFTVYTITPQSPLNPIFQTATALASMPSATPYTLPEPTYTLPEPTATPAPPSPTVEIFPQLENYLASYGMNVRSCPSSDCPIVGSVFYGDVVTVSASEAVNGVIWRQISLGDLAGYWVAERRVNGVIYLGLRP